MGQNKIEDIGPVEERKWYDGFFQWGDSIKQVAQKEQAKASDWIGAAAKTILGTNTDILTNLVSGVVGWGEDVVDAGASLAGILTETFGWDSATQNIRDFVTKDLYDEQEITRNLFKTGALTNAFAATNPGLAVAIPTMFTIEEWLNPTKSVYNGFGGIENIKDDNSVLGETSKGILQSTGETLAKQGIQLTTGIPVGDIITGVTVFGSQAEQALKEDANFMQAGGSGLISSAAEIMFQKLSGGIKISGHTLDEGLTKLMSRSISNVALRNFLNFTKDIGGEAIEEAATEFVDKLGTLLYKDRDQWDEILFSKDALVDYIQSAISGGLMGGAFNAANAVNSTKKGVDYKSGLTNDEQKVVDKVTENAIKQKETDGKKLSAKEKNLLYNDILKQLEDGDISITDIEDALGEEVFKDYADTIKYEEDILKQYEELGKKKNYTLAEASLFNELDSKKKDIEQNSPREELKKQMSEKVFDRVKDTKLMNSYANEARRGETFKADVNEYDEAERATIQSAIDAGFLNNTNKTRRFVNWVAKIAANTGIKVDFTTIEKLKESGFAVDGKFVNGYKTKDGIGINMQSKKILETVVGHEITHVFEGTELYNEMQKVLFDYADSKGELETRRKSMEELYKDMDADIDSELTAELVGDYLFTDQEFINRLANDNRNLFQKIWDEVKYMWKQAHPSSPEAQKLEKLKRAFEEAYKHSKGESNNLVRIKNKSTQASEPNALIARSYGMDASMDSIPQKTDLSSGFEKNSAKNDISVLEGGSVTKFSLSTWTPETQKRVKNDLVKSGFDSAQVDKWIADTNSVAAVIAADKDRLDFEAADNQVMLKDNQEYIKTLDASTLCAKRLVYQGTFDAIQHRLPNTVLTSDDLIDLLNMMKEKGVQTPCGVCYVESRRRHLGKFAKEWLDGYQGEYKPNLDDVTTSDGLEALRKSHPQTYKDFIDAMNKKGSSNPKVVQLRTEYRNEIMSLTPAQIRKIEAIGGLRVQSFSDFETPHMLDMMQAVMDMSAKGLHSQAYTKVPNFAWVFGDTGIKINLSLIAEGDGFDADGNLAFSSTEGMSIDDAMALRDAYSSNVGTIIVGANDKHILACMADDRIDFIIPFHRSGWGKNELDMMGMSSYTDYTYGQKEHDLATGKGVANLYPPDYWDYSVSGKENAEKYLNLCAKLGREPKFSQFLVNNGDGSYSLQPDGSTDGYWKTLIDFKMYDNNGVGAAQQTVQPNFNMTEAYRVLNEYEGGANKLPVANEVVDEFVAKKQGVQFSLSEDTTEEIHTVQERLAEKLKNTKAELENDKRLRQESIDDYDDEISRLQSEYDAKQNKTTRAANDILRRIERLQRIKGNVDADYAKRISDLEKKVENMSKPEYRIAAQRMEKQEEYTTKMKELVGDTSTWTDKKLGVFYKTNTLRRNLRDIVRDANGNRDIAKADAIYEEIQGKYSQNEALLNKESNKLKKPYADMDITKAEDAYIQMLGELRYNPDTTLTEDVVNKYYEENKGKIDVEKVNKAIEMARKTYDDLLVRVNKVLREQGMKEIPYRQGYFPHFTEDKQGILAKILNWKTQNTDIPTDIAGITEQFNPDRSWQSFNKQRTTDTTDYSFTKGLDSYVQGALDWIYHIEDIQKRRALENYIRYTHSDQGIKDKIDAIRKNETYDADEMQAQIDLVYKEAKNPLNNFVTDLRAGTNRLANKKSSLDRTVEEMTNRKIYSTMTNISNRVTGNMVAGSVSSALTNFIPITQSWGQVSPVSSLKAMGDTIKSIAKDDGTIAKSDFLTNRLNKAENLYKTTWDKVGDTLGSLMEGIDNFTAQTVWRSKYIENMSNGMSEAEAIKNADQFASNVMASRSRGETPTIFDSKNPLIKTLTAFQLEVNNQYGYMFKDMPQDIGTDAKGKLAKGYVAMFLGAYAYNALYSSLTGRDSAFDPVGIIMDLLNDLFGDDEEEPVDALMNFGENVVEELPFIGGLAGGGRIPISSALPYDGLGAAITGTIEDVSEGNWKSLTKEWLNPLYYLVMPMGGGQLKKSIEGLSMYSPDHPVAGSYTDSGNLRFPVEEDLASVAQAAVFGQWANKNAQKYLEDDIAPINESKIQEYVDSGLTIEEYWDYREGLKKFSTKEQKIKYINGLDIEEWQKSVLISYLSKNNSSTSKKTISSSQYDKAMELLDDFNNRFGNN